jgi:predicted Holliday junction resolvase-like endonuclease
VETLLVWVVIAIAIVAVIIDVRALRRKYNINLADLYEAWRERPTPPPLRRSPEEKAFWLVIFVAIGLCALWYW